MKTAAELEMTDEELEALIWTRHLLSSGSLTLRLSEDNVDGINAFNMRKACDIGRECGAVMCIGGWMHAKVMALANGSDVVRLTPEQEDAIGGLVTAEERPHLRALFFPYTIDEWDMITPSMAVEAIDNVLKHRKPLWAEIQRRHGLT